MGNLPAMAMGQLSSTALLHDLQGYDADLARERMESFNNVNRQRASIFQDADSKREAYMDARRLFALTKCEEYGSINSAQQTEKGNLLSKLKQTEMNEELLKSLKEAYEVAQDEAERKMKEVEDIAQARDKEIDLEKTRVEQQITLVTQMRDAYKEGFKTASSDFKPNFGGQT